MGINNVSGNYYSPHVLKQQVLLNPDMLIDRRYYNSTGVIHNPNPSEIQVMPNNGTNPAAGNQAAQSQPENGNTPDVNEDEGKIGWLKAAKNFGIGCLKLVGNLFCDEKGNPSLWQTLKNATLAAAICLIPGGPAVALAIGGLLSTIGLAQGISEMNEAKTDAEDAQAWQDIGTNTLAFALSILGIKSLKGKGFGFNKNTNSTTQQNNSGFFSRIANYSQKIKKLGNKDTRNNFINNKVKQGKDFLKQIPENFNSMKTKYNNAKKQIKDAKTAKDYRNLAWKGMKTPFVTLKGRALLSVSNGFRAHDEAA